MSETKTAKAAVELTKNEEGTWLNVDIGGRKATVSLNNASRGPMITGIPPFSSTGDAALMGHPVSVAVWATVGNWLSKTVNCGWAVRRQMG